MSAADPFTRATESYQRAMAYSHKSGPGLTFYAPRRPLWGLLKLVVTGAIFWAALLGLAAVLWRL